MCIVEDHRKGMWKDGRGACSLNATLTKGVPSVQVTLSTQYFNYKMNPFML